MGVLIYSGMDVPIQNVKLALSISQARAAKRVLKGAKVMGRGTSSTQAEAFRRTQSLRDKLLQGNLELMERGGGMRGVLTGHRARRGRKMLGRTETQLKRLEKQKGVKVFLAGQVEQAAKVTSPAETPGLGTPGRLLAGASLLGGGYVLGNIDRRRPKIPQAPPNTSFSSAVGQY